MYRMRIHADRKKDAKNDVSIFLKLEVFYIDTLPIRKL